MTDMYGFETMDSKGESVHLVAVCDKHPHIRFQSAIGHIIGIINFSYSWKHHNRLFSPFDLCSTKVPSIQGKEIIKVSLCLSKSINTQIKEKVQFIIAHMEFGIKEKSETVVIASRFVIIWMKY